MNVVAWNVFSFLINISLYVILPLAAILGFVKARVFFRNPTSKDARVAIGAQGKAKDLFPKPILIMIRYSEDSLSCEIRQIGNFGKDPYDRLYLSYLTASRSPPFLVREQANDGSFIVQYLSTSKDSLEVDWMNLHSHACVSCDDIYRAKIVVMHIIR